MAKKIKTKLKTNSKQTMPSKKIPNNKIPNNNLNLILNAIVLKKELSQIDDKFIKKTLQNYLKTDQKSLKYLKQNKKISKKSKDFKIIVKAVRAKLRRSHSLFTTLKQNKIPQKSLSEFEIKIKNAKNTSELKILANKILKTHKSSLERLDSYTLFYKKINSLITNLTTTKPLNKKKANTFTILDLGCGLNPISIIKLPKIKTQKINYFSFDINKSEQSLIQTFFNKFTSFQTNFKGKANILDLLNTKKISKLPKSDLALLLKVTDHLDQGQGHKKTELTIKAIPTKNIIISFPTITSSNKPMRYPDRKWVELLCKRLKYDLEKFQTTNELFYLIKK